MPFYEVFVCSVTASGGSGEGEGAGTGHNRTVLKREREGRVRQKGRTTLTLAELQNAPQLIISKCVKSHAAHVVVYEN